MAVTVAIAVPFYQNYQQYVQRADAERQARLDGINAILALMDHIYHVNRRLRDALLYSRPSMYGHDLSEKSAVAHDLKQAAAMLREIPVTAISNEMVHFLVGLREVVNSGEHAAGVMLSAVTYDGSKISKKAKDNMGLMDRWFEELADLDKSIREK